MKKNNLQITGAPFGKYPGWNPEGINHFTVGIPVSNMVKPIGNIMVDSIPSMEALMVSHFGPYETTGDAHVKQMKQLSFKLFGHIDHILLYL